MCCHGYACMCGMQQMTRSWQQRSAFQVPSCVARQQHDAICYLAPLFNCWAPVMHTNSSSPAAVQHWLLHPAGTTVSARDLAQPHMDTAGCMVFGSNSGITGGVPSCECSLLPCGCTLLVGNASMDVADISACKPPRLLNHAVWHSPTPAITCLLLRQVLA
jgi:hypothetical protein